MTDDVSLTNRWETPLYICKGIARLTKQLNITNDDYYDLDCCANPINSKCDRFISINQDALKTEWDGNHIWCNPPYGRGLLEPFVERAIQQLSKPTEQDRFVTFLVNTDMSTQWFHRLITSGHCKAVIHVIKGRINFLDPQNASASKNAKKPNTIIVLGSKRDYGAFPTYYVTLDNLIKLGA